MEQPTLSPVGAGNGLGGEYPLRPTQEAQSFARKSNEMDDVPELVDGGVDEANTDGVVN